MSSNTSSSSNSRSSSAPASQNPSTVDEPVLRIEPHSVFVPNTIPDSLTSDELSLIRIQYGVPPEYELELPGPTDRASTEGGETFSPRRIFQISSNLGWNNLKKNLSYIF